MKHTNILEPVTRISTSINSSLTDVMWKPIRWCEWLNSRTIAESLDQLNDISEGYSIMASDMQSCQQQPTVRNWKQQHVMGCRNNNMYMLFLLYISFLSTHGYFLKTVLNFCHAKSCSIRLYASTTFNFPDPVVCKNYLVFIFEVYIPK